MHSSPSDAGLLTHATSHRRVARHLAHLACHVVRVGIRLCETPMLADRVGDRRRSLLSADELGEVVRRILRVGHVHDAHLAVRDALVQAR